MIKSVSTVRPKERLTPSSSRRIESNHWVVTKTITLLKEKLRMTGD
jgi:hypothetical protein